MERMVDLDISSNGDIAARSVNGLFIYRPADKSVSLFPGVRKMKGAFVGGRQNISNLGISNLLAEPKRILSIQTNYSHAKQFK